MENKTQIIVAAIILVTLVGIGIPLIVGGNGVGGNGVGGNGTAVPPTVKDPGAEPYVIPEDTDGVPSWGESATLSVNVTDDTAISTVRSDLADGGGSSIMTLTGNYTESSTLWCMFNDTTNASVGTANWNGTAYVPLSLQVNATNINSNVNTSVSIDLLVMKNGDVNVDGNATFSDAMYLYKWKAGKPGFDTIYETVADVNGDGRATFSDAMYLYKWKAGKPGFDVLR